MIRIVTDYLDRTVQRCPDKTAFTDERRSLTFRQLRDEAHHLAFALIAREIRKRPVLIYLDKSVEVIAAFLGTAGSGNFYSPIDTRMPAERIGKIIGRLEPAAVITDAAHRAEAEALLPQGQIIVYEEAMAAEIREEAVRAAADRVIDTDILYVLFTSGSTGTPKGAVISHRAVIDFTEWAAEDLGFDGNSVMGNQCPLYFSMSIYDVFETLKCGCTTHIIPQKLFSQPVRLMEFLEEKQVNTLVWVPSVLMFLSTLRALNRPHLTRLRQVYFGAEVFQTKHLNRWMDEYPEVRFVNIYGPTEITDTCAFYEVRKRFGDSEMLPIGVSCRNKECFLLDEADRLVTGEGAIGEICVRGSGLAYGYYNDPGRTAEAFVQNPLNTACRELIYRTGDLARYNGDGDLVYVCRKDFQIKHLGHRIELGEIEAAASALEGVEDCCCLYDTEKQRIVLFYSGSAESREIHGQLTKALPDYMIPGGRVRLEALPKNVNGKTDRQKLKAMMRDEG